MSTLRQLLQGARAVIAVPPDAGLPETIAAMVENDISAVAVVDGGALAGIVTERDLVRKAMAAGRAAQRVGEIMTSEVISVSPADTAEACMALMIEHHVRHLPVLEQGRLVGMLSMRDLVRHVLAEKEFAIREMTNYIAGAPASAALR